jgi:cation:H+ antiporter
MSERFTAHWAVIAAMALVGVLGILFGDFPGIAPIIELHLDPLLESAIFGIAILAAAFLLSWGAETAELDISQGLALAIIAFIAVLPEYAVDAFLAWEAGSDPEKAAEGLAIANMTGGNRLLIGIGWPIVFLIFFYRRRLKELVVSRTRALELAFLAVATVYVILIPLRGTLTLADTIVLVSMFLIYLVMTSRVESDHTELVGPARAMGSLPDFRRRAVVVGTLIFAAAVIIASAEPFAHGLVDTGKRVNISEFVLIQWVAPLASESPEVLVAALLAWRGRAAAGMGALISSKVNQWTLLIGTLPIAFMIGSGDWGILQGLPLVSPAEDISLFFSRQQGEIFLTAAQSAFAIAVFVNLRMSRPEAWALFILFAAQLPLTEDTLGDTAQIVRFWYSIGYMALCAVLLVRNRMAIPGLIRDARDMVTGKADFGEESHH